MNDLRSLFTLDPAVIFLNHGSFGATPRPVMEVYQDWQHRLEEQPVHFLVHETPEHFRQARQQLSEYLGVNPGNLVFVPNATFGVNVVARSLDFQPGDEVLTSNHENGACENVWSFLKQQNGLNIVKQDIPLPLPDKNQLVEIIWSGVSARTRLIFLSQITSPTAVRLPVEEICQRAREGGILILIDGAHAPGQMTLDLEELGADFYTGNCHKWLMAPKGSAFLNIRPEHQEFIQPLVVGWGWGENCPYENDSRLVANLEWLGTLDPAAYFSVPAAIDFHREHQWDEVREECQLMLADLLQKIEGLTGMPSIYGKNEGNFIQIGAAEIPPESEPQGLQKWLYEEYKIEIPVIEWENRWLIRPSVQGYNSQEDLDLLLEALEKYFKVCM
ncbi:MAG: aminotransferase class V-fold PLP-dependent enzyme [Chloroflexi bacterium]|nr:aminotransferase class V-fold PLP-dependent enzyme [Chloroflexota bacterium]